MANKNPTPQPAGTKLAPPPAKRKPAAKRPGDAPAKPAKAKPPKQANKKKDKKQKKQKKAKKVAYTPKGQRTVTAYLIVHDAKAALKFYKQAFDAKLKARVDMGGKIGHAEIQIGDCKVMLADEFPDMQILSAKSVGGSAVTLMLYVKDCDKVIARALKHGAKQSRPTIDQFWGDRAGEVIDPFGHKWSIATHIEDVSPKEIDRRLAKMMAGG